MGDDFAYPPETVIRTEGTGKPVDEAVEKRIILVHNTAHYLHLHYVDLVRDLIAHGWAVTCVAPRDSATVMLEAVGVECADLPLSRRGLNPFLEASALRALYRIFHSAKPSVVLNFSIKPAIYGSLAARAAGVPRICSMITGLGYVFLGRGAAVRWLAVAAAWGYRAALSGNHRVFFQNPDDRDFFLRRHIAAKRQCVVLNGTGIDIKRFSPRPMPESASEVGFLMVTRLLADKGVREFAKACREIQSKYDGVRCAILGPRDDNPAVISERELQTWVDEGHVEYLGETDDVAEVIAKYDVFVLPSYREGLPRATLEAMAMGKPVITTDVPGCRQTVVDGVNGHLVPPRDAAALASAMERFVIDPGIIPSMGRASRKIAEENFDVQGVNRVILRHLGACHDSS